MKVNIFPHLSGSLSMKRYFDGFLGAIDEEHEVMVYAPVKDFKNLTIRERYLGSILNANKVTEGINLILSERFSFLLWWLNPSLTGVVCHDMITLRNPNISNITKWRYKLSIRWMSKAKHIFCISESTKEDLLKFNEFIDPSKISVIHNGLDAFWLEDQNKEGINLSVEVSNLVKYKYFLSVGTDSWNKNFALLISAFAGLGDLDCILVKVGPISRKNKLLIRQFGIEDRVYQLNSVSDVDLKWLYNHALAFVFPSMYEGFGWPPLEAIACGCPVITSRVSSIPEVCGEGAYYVNKYDDSNFTLAMKEMMNPVMRDQFIAKAKKCAHLFKWEDTTKKMLANFVQNRVGAMGR